MIRPRDVDARTSLCWEGKALGSLAMLIVAIDCFQTAKGELGLPYWVWVIAGVSWLLNIHYLFRKPS